MPEFGAEKKKLEGSHEIHASDENHAQKNLFENNSENTGDGDSKDRSILAEDFRQ